VSKASAIVKKSAKIIAWVIAGILLLAISLILILRIPAVQTALVHKVTNYLESKTHTTISIGNLYIGFPSTVILKEVFLNDLEKDTLLYVKNAEAGIDLVGLISGNISLGDVTVNGLKGNIIKYKADSTFNFNFLIEAFAGNTKPTTSDTAVKPLDISVDVVRLSDIDFHFRDEPGGIDIKSIIGYAEIPFKEIKIDSMEFNVGLIVLNNSHIDLIQSGSAAADTGSALMPVLNVTELSASGIIFRMVNTVDSSGVYVESGDFNITDAGINMKRNTINAGDISFNRSSAMLFNRKKTQPVVIAADTASLPAVAFAIPAINVKSIKASNSSFVMQGIDTTRTEVFNPSNIHMVISKVDMKNIYYNEGTSRIDINEVAISDHSGFAVKHLEGQFRNDSVSTTVKNLALITTNSELYGDLKARYRDFEMLAKEPGKTQLNIALTNSVIGLKDIFYFNDDLLKQELFRKNRERKFVINATANGFVNNLDIASLTVRTANSTFIDVTGKVTGLPDVENLFMNINANRVLTTSADIRSMATVPETINIPEQMNMTASYKGSLSTFEYKLFAGTNRGLVTSTGSVYNLSSNAPAYTISAILKDADLGYILKNDSLYGIVDLKAYTKGVGFDPETMKSVFDVQSDKITLNKYEYNNIILTGGIADGSISVKGAVKDENLDIDIDAQTGIIPEKEFYKGVIKVNGSDLKALHFSENELRASCTATVDLKGNKMNNLTGNAGVKELLVIKNGKNYAIETFAFASINEKTNKSVSIESTLLNANFTGNITVDETPKLLTNFFNRYFEDKTAIVPFDSTDQNFKFTIVVNNAPIISEVFVPGLESFIPGPISGSFSSANSKLDVNVEIPQLVYEGIRIDSLKLKVFADVKALSMAVTLTRLSMQDIQLKRTEFTAVASDNKINSMLAIFSEETTKLKISTSLIRAEDANVFRIAIKDNGIILNDEKWTIPDDNYADIGGPHPLFHNFSLSHNKESISLVHPAEGPEGLGIKFSQFDIGLVSGIIERDTSYLDGILNGHLDLVYEKEGTGLMAAVKLDKFVFRGIPVGDFVFDAKSEGNARYSLTMKMTGQGNDLNASGFYEADTTGGKIKADINIGNVSLHSIEPFSYGQMANSTGAIKGSFKVDGTIPAPQVKGELIFANAGFNLTYLNNYFKIKDEKIQIDEEGIYFNSFTINDSLNNTATLNGDVDLNELENPVFKLDLRTDKFIAMNTQPENNELFFGSLIISSNIKVRGDKNLPVVTANVKLQDKSSFTFIVPETVVQTERGEDDVVFTDPYNRVNRIMKKSLPADTFRAEITGFDITSNIEVTKESTLRIVVDRESGDSLVIKGDATMSFSIDPSGKTSLTGGFEINDGSYRASLQNLVKKNFKITKGSSINWRGDITDAEINIDAINEVNTSAFELVADQIAGLTETQANVYRQRLPFQVILHMDGQLMKPEISFEISMPPEDRGVLNGTVWAKLNLLNQDPSELNKQVFALLVLNRFIQNNPFDNGGGGAYVARNSVSKFLSQQLNVFAEQYIKGVELNFDVQSYEDYSTEGKVEGRTEVNIGVSKRFLKDRMVVSVAGNVDVEGERAKQNNVSNLAGDIVLEYMLTADGRYRLRVFRKDQYEGILDGEVKEAGIGVLYTKDFDKWNQLFKKADPPVGNQL
jgi:hypothetical protein